jgi:hypothetical protein
VSTNQLAATQAQRASVLGRYVDSTNFYLLRCDFNPDQVVGWGITRSINNTQVTINSGLVDGVTHAVDRKFWVRGQGTTVGGVTTLRVKVWQDGTDEPSVWAGSGTDSTFPAPAQIGIRTSVVAGNTNTAPLVYTIDSFSNGAWDDLTDQTGPLSVSQALDDGMPSDITYTSGSDSTSSATVSVGARAGLPAQQYWSQDRADSPIVAYERDVAPMQVAAGAVTAGGIQRVTVFTGQMSDSPVSGTTASVDAVSKTRLALTKLVQPPPIVGDTVGLNATWPISWSLAQCGLYVSPPPRPGCRFWAPMHGSLYPFLPSTGGSVTANAWFALLTTAASYPTGVVVRPTFTAGPYASAAFAEGNPDRISIFMSPVDFASGPSLLSQTASTGRVEFWVRGDTVNLNTTPGGSGSLSTNAYANFVFANGVGSVGPGFVRAGIDVPTRKVMVSVDDGAGHTATLKSSSPVPSDGAWHFVGAAYSISGKKLWVRLDNTTESSTAATLVTSSLPPADTFDPDSGVPGFDFMLPMAELHITGGDQANPDNYPWINDTTYTWTQGAVMRPSILDLVALAETLPTEAATYIANYAQAELAVTRTDELDRYCYLPMSYWAEAAQQTVAETLSTDSNVGVDHQVSRDLTRIRNQVVVNYTDTRTSSLQNPTDVLISFTVYPLPPGKTTLTLTFTGPTVKLPANPAFYLVTASDVSAGETSVHGQHSICANTVNDGSARPSRRGTQAKPSSP